MQNPHIADRDHRTAVRRSPSERMPLDRHYRAIGISAVAAAARYPVEKRRPAYAPTHTREQD